MKNTSHGILREALRGLPLLLLLGSAPALLGEDRHGADVCTNASLNGTYGFYRAGTTSDGPLAAVGILSFDGKGNSTATQQINRAGEIALDVTFGGLYSVAPDCTATGYTTDGTEFVRLVVVDDGNGLLMFSESSIVYGVGTKIHTRRGDGPGR